MGDPNKGLYLVPRDYIGRILNGYYSVELKRRLVECIDSYKAFEETGGFSERLTAKRIEARQKGKPASPDCPLCGKPMRQRNSVRGDFWGCSAFPGCKGTMPL